MSSLRPDAVESHGRGNFGLRELAFSGSCGRVGVPSVALSACQRFSAHAAATPIHPVPHPVAEGRCPFSAREQVSETVLLSKRLGVIDGTSSHVSVFYQLKG